MKKWRDILILASITIASAILIWLPFYLGLGKGMLTVFANYDGPYYLVIAKSLYNEVFIQTAFSFPTPIEYYPAHLPSYPLIVRLFDFILPGTWSLLFSTQLSMVLAVIAFYFLVKKYFPSLPAFWLSIVFLFLPARFLAVRSIGSPEPLFIFAILASLYFFKDKKYLLAGIFGIIAQITKTPGILLFAAYFLIIIMEFIKTKKINWRAWPIFLIPLSILPVFLFYQIQTGDFFAYFHSGDNFHLVFPPFQSFSTGRSWLGDFWLEDIVYAYLFGILTVILLFKQKFYDLAIFCLIFFTATLFIAHRDLSRYSLPLAPFAIIAFAPFFEKKEFKIAFFFILIPIYLYSINFILNNSAPISDWAPFL